MRHFFIQGAQRGFTLIELLIVVTLIAILSGVVLTSVTTSRSKGADGGLKKQLLEVRGQAELFYNNNNSTYHVDATTNVCNSGTNNINSMLVKAAALSGSTLVINGAAQTTTTTNCNSSSAGFAASSKLKTPSTATYLCVDSVNKLIQTTTALGAGVVTCS